MQIEEASQLQLGQNQFDQPQIEKLSLSFNGDSSGDRRPASSLIQMAMDEKSENNGVKKKIMSPCDVEALKKCLEENKGDYVKCQSHIEAFKSSCSLKKPPNLPSQSSLLKTGMEQEVIEADIVLPTHLSFKKVQMYEKYPKGQARGRHWKHLKQIIQAENYENYPSDEPNYVNIESPPSMHPCKRICDITGYEAPYYDPRTNLRYANVDVFKLIRSLPNEYVQRYLTLRNAAVVLK
ncbi:unnamed protein product [Camellia sinensis]